MKARALIVMTLSVVANRAGAEPWAITPRLGVSSDYSSNPELRFGNEVAEKHVAALIDVPLSYDADGVEVTLRPNGRLSDSRGYSSLASNYAHIDGSVQVVQDLDSFSAQAQLAREASLYDIGAASTGVGVRRDSANLSTSWTRNFNERSSLQVDLGGSRLRFDHSGDLPGLVDYRYLSAGPTFTYAATERTSVNFAGSIGRYHSLNGRTASNSESLQAGLGRQLTELWRLDASAGYSRALDRQKIYFGPYYLGTQSSNQNGAVYSLSLARRGERVNVGMSASRSLQPVGVSFLSRRDNFNLSATYALSERWDFSLGLAWQRDAELVLGQSVLNRRYLSAGLTANWHWTERWMVSAHANRVGLSYGPPTISTSSSGFSLDLVRQFLRTEL